MSEILVSRWLLGWTVLLLVLVPACVVEMEVAPPEEGGHAVPEDLPPGVTYVGPGSEATTFLRPDPPRLVVEIDQAAGAELTSSAVAHLETVIESVVDKPGGVSIQVSTFEPAEDSFTGDDLRRLEEERRQTQTDSQLASIYILVLGGQFRDSPGVIGAAYSASSFAIFVEQAARPGMDRAAVERAVLVHEVGHLFALVDIGYESPRPREDPDSPNHSMNEESVMHHAIESAGVFDVLGPAPPDDFDEDDRADLADIASGAITPEL